VIGRLSDKIGKFRTFFAGSVTAAVVVLYYTRLGLTPVPIETPEGRAEYVGHQRDFADRSALLRQRLIAECDPLLTFG
jgi:hypothetical protein